MAEKIDNFYEINKLYSITMNPVDSSQFLGKKDRYKKFHTHIYNLLIDMDIKYDLTIELSEPHGKMFTQGYSGPRLHLHGAIMFPDRKSLSKFLLNYHYKINKISSIDIDTINNKQTWTNYCKKQHILPADRHLFNSPLLYDN